MTHSKITKILLQISEYIKSPFVVLGACLFIIEKLAPHWEAAEHFITLYWANQFHLVFLVPTFYLARKFSLSPYRSAIKMISFRKKNRAHAISIINILNLTLYLEIVFFFIEALIIMAEQLEGAIVNKEAFVMWSIITKFIIFVGIPALSSLWQFLIKNMLIKDGIYLIDHIDYQRILPQAWMYFIIALISAIFFSFITPTNYYLESLDFLSNILKPYTDIWRNISGSL